jgi:hypothetical protein
MWDWHEIVLPRKRLKLWCGPVVMAAFFKSLLRARVLLIVAEFCQRLAHNHVGNAPSPAE